MKNKWYNNQSITPRQFMWDIEVDPTQMKETELSFEDTQILRNLILNTPFSRSGHKCISVYRDTGVLDDNIYHLCLSCGDMIHKSERQYLTINQRDELQKLKNKLFFNNEKEKTS